MREVLPLHPRMQLMDPVSVTKLNVCAYLGHACCFPECYQALSLPGRIILLRETGK